MNWKDLLKTVWQNFLVVFVCYAIQLVFVDVKVLMTNTFN